jgi:hypothetical protein
MAPSRLSGEILYAQAVAPPRLFLRDQPDIEYRR